MPSPAGQHRGPADPGDEPRRDHDAHMPGDGGGARRRAQHDQAEREHPPMSAIVREHAGGQKRGGQAHAHRAERPGQPGGAGPEPGRSADTRRERRHECEQHQPRAHGDDAEDPALRRARPRVAVGARCVGHPPQPP